MVQATYDYDELSARVSTALRQTFAGSEDYIKTEKGHGGRVRVLIISDALRGKSEREKQDLVWDSLRTRLGQDAQGVSLAIAYSTDELM
jgi:acid stress-induced BolA-like protein IbaG/YrbA